ncbi:MAG: segregation/condensation protein A [bacterium]|nr:segregation/condensation protein A [bacterium]
METNAEGFKLKIEKFEGPLNLLLSLIEKRKMHISDVSLAKVADDFISYIKSFDRFPVAESAHFILVASILVLIKSKSLLPTLELSKEEEASMEDLEKRLLIYSRIKELTPHLKSLFGKKMFSAFEERKQEPIFLPDKDTNIEALGLAIQRVLRSLPKKEVLPKVVVKKVISLENMVADLTKRITANLKMSFNEFSAEKKHDRAHIIVSFLAMLELVRQGIMNATQEKHFDDIMMETEEVKTPSYGS